MALLENQMPSNKDSVYLLLIDDYISSNHLSLTRKINLINFVC